MVKAMAPNAPIGATFTTSAMTPNIACATSSIRLRTVWPRSPKAMSEKPNRIANSSTCRISPCAKAPTTVSGMMCKTKSTDFISLACFAKPATAPAFDWPEKPTPGCSTFATIKPSTSAKVETISK